MFKPGGTFEIIRPAYFPVEGGKPAGRPAQGHQEVTKLGIQLGCHSEILSPMSACPLLCFCHITSSSLLSLFFPPCSLVSLNVTVFSAQSPARFKFYVLTSQILFEKIFPYYYCYWVLFFKCMRKIKIWVSAQGSLCSMSLYSEYSTLLVWKGKEYI